VADPIAFYNEIEPFAADWLESLIHHGVIPFGVVDRRPIEQLEPEDLECFTQCHFFAGIGGWPWALQLADWPDDQPVWTGSCPCQPFSVSGKRKGTDDVRHLWPYWQYLISECRPPVVFGEQVASPLGRSWLADVRTDLEDVGYRVGAADLCAAGAGAPHLRQRLYWVADCTSNGWRQECTVTTRDDGGGQEEGQRAGSRTGSSTGRVANPNGRDAEAEGIQRSGEHRQQQEDGGVDSRVGIPNVEGLEGRSLRRSKREGERAVGKTGGDANHSHWSRVEWIKCADGRSRPIEPNLSPLVDGPAFVLADGSSRKDTSRSALIRGIGNAIVAPLAAEFVMAYVEAAEK
jgi:DNA (cytosine-5)-methyltransferase 1